VKKYKTVRSPVARKVKSAPDLPATFVALKKILASQAGRLRVAVDKPGKYYLETPGPCYRGKPLCLVAVQTGKAYVSFHFLPVYMDRSLLKQVPPQLKKSLKGKACFHFTSPDPVLMRQLGALTRTGLARFRSPQAILAILQKAQHG
jgi:hypothetical protein